MPSEEDRRKLAEGFGEPAQFYGTIVGPLGRRSGGKEESGKTNPQRDPHAAGLENVGARTDGERRHAHLSQTTVRLSGLQQNWEQLDAAAGHPKRG